MSSEKDRELIERLVRLETDTKWMTKEMESLKRSVNRARWELVSGIILLVLIQLLLRLSG